MFRTEMRAHAQDIYARLLAQWLATRQSTPSPQEAADLSRQSIEFARIFFDAAEPRE